VEVDDAVDRRIGRAAVPLELPGGVGLGPGQLRGPVDGDLENLAECAAGDLRCAVSLPPNVRDAFATGAWDTTGLLLERYEDVNATSARLPYIAGV